jgi:hypothetical protein
MIDKVISGSPQISKYRCFSRIATPGVQQGHSHGPCSMLHQPRRPIQSCAQLRDRSGYYRLRSTISLSVSSLWFTCDRWELCPRFNQVRSLRLLQLLRPSALSWAVWQVWLWHCSLQSSHRWAASSRYRQQVSQRVSEEPYQTCPGVSGERVPSTLQYRGPYLTGGASGVCIGTQSYTERTWPGTPLLHNKPYCSVMVLPQSNCLRKHARARTPPAPWPTWIGD